MEKIAKIKILADGNTIKARDNARGKLFENFMAEIFQKIGYEIDDIPNVNYAGMEIDIEGKLIATNNPLYAECKCYETAITAPKLRDFYGKYMAKWRKNKNCHGLFIALPSINSSAKGFYNEYIRNDSEINFKILEEPKVLDLFLRNRNIIKPEEFSRLIPIDLGKPGDCVLLYADKAIFWIQYLIPEGGGFPTKVIIFDINGNMISEKDTIDYIKRIWPELNDFEILVSEITNHSPIIERLNEIEEVVEVQGSSSCFEYQFPASPAHFVGRNIILSEITKFSENIVKKNISSRSILFEGNSGWGKSSLILACVFLLQKMGHFAIAIDSRSASSSQFILRVISYSFKKILNMNNSIEKSILFEPISGFEGAVKNLIALGKELEKQQKIIFIFLDQFENLFYLHETLKRIRNVFLRILDAQTNVVIGFSWKSDLIGLTNEFPYKMRDAIAQPSKIVKLKTFSSIETDILLNKLATVIKAPLRKDLKFFLSEFSQGYPWLLKKLCAHVKTQIQRQKSIISIANSLLNIEELFLEDIRGLSAPEIDSLKRIARLAPISIQELGEDYKTNIIQSLVNQRLLVKIGSKYDVYWDIFRDYLNTGRVPVQDNYILRTEVQTILNATKILIDSGKKLNSSQFQKKIKVKEKYFYNIIKDMKLLGIVKVYENNVEFDIELPFDNVTFEYSIRTHLRERLKRNRLIWQVLYQLEAKGSFEIKDIANILENSCPYISATKNTWKTYARKVAKWIDAADLALFDSKTGLLSHYNLEDTELRERRLSIMKGRGGINYPPIQYKPIENVALRLYDAFLNKKGMDLSGISKSTIYKALSVLESFGFIIRKPKSILLLDDLMEFASNKEERHIIFGKFALKINSFSKFIEILESNKQKKLNNIELSKLIKDELNPNWKDSTAKFYTKVLLDWARSTNLAPKIYIKKREHIKNNIKNIKALDEFLQKK